MESLVLNKLSTCCYGRSHKLCLLWRQSRGNVPSLADAASSLGLVKGKQSGMSETPEYLGSRRPRIRFKVSILHLLTFDLGRALNPTSFGFYTFKIRMLIISGAVILRQYIVTVLCKLQVEKIWSPN